MIEGKFIHGDQDLAEVFKIRREVFCEEQHISEEEEFDDLDKEALHVIISEKQQNVAVGRLVKIDHYYKIGRIAVLKECRGMHYGDFVVRMLVDKAFQLGAKEVHVGAQTYAKGFYEKIGFKVDGEQYIEAGIPHLPMKIVKGSLCSGCGHNA